MGSLHPRSRVRAVGTLEAREMNWHWFSFLIGAPIWSSIGIALFAALLAAGNRSQRTRSMLDPGVTSLSEYRLRRNLRLAVFQSGAAREGR